MTAFDPCYFLVGANRCELHTVKYYGYVFDTEYDSSVFDELKEKFFFKSLNSVSKLNGQSEVVTIGVYGENVSNSSFIITDLDKTHILCCAQFNIEMKPGTIILLNCPEIAYKPLYSMVIKNEHQISEIGVSKNFGYCDKNGAHLACTKFVDRSKDNLCSFHKTYYRLRIANQFLIQSQIFPTSFPVRPIYSNHNSEQIMHTAPNLTRIGTHLRNSSTRTYSTINSSI